jgi:uncharacterized protein
VRVDLGSLDLRAGAVATLRLRVPVEDFSLAGQAYVAVPSRPEMTLEVARTLGGKSLRLRGDLALEGPCWRCLEPVRVPVAIDAREFAGPGEAEGEPDDEMASAYVEGEELDVEQWVRDAVAEALPSRLVHGEGEPCADPPAEAAEEAGEPEADPRWAPLARLAAEMREREGG